MASMIGNIVKNSTDITDEVILTSMLSSLKASLHILHNNGRYHSGTEINAFKRHGASNEQSFHVDRTGCKAWVGEALQFTCRTAGKRI